MREIAGLCLRARHRRRLVREQIVEIRHDRLNLRRDTRARDRGRDPSRAPLADDCAVQHKRRETFAKLQNRRDQQNRCGESDGAKVNGPRKIRMGWPYRTSLSC